MKVGDIDLIKIQTGIFVDSIFLFLTI